MRGRSSFLAVAIALIGCAGAIPIDPSDRDAIDLAPPEPSGSSLTRWLAPAGRIFPAARSREYAPRVIAIETSPRGASLDLFYLRQNLQQRLVHAEAPARVKLPPRSEAARDDVVVVRALLEGYREREARIAVRGDVDRVSLDLEPLPNALESVALRYLGGRGSLELMTREKLAFRIQNDERGFHIVLLETQSARASEPPLMTGSASPLIEEIEYRQLGTDLVVSAALTDRARAEIGAPRLRESIDSVRGLHILAVELTPDRSAAFGGERAGAAFARVSQRRVSGCTLEFDRVLRAELYLADPARVRTRSDGNRDALVHDALERLASISPGGAIRMADGRTLRPTRPVELSTAEADAPAALGFFAVLRAAVDEIEAPADRRAALQTLIAPDLPAAAFGAALDRAQAAESVCTSAGH